GARLDRELEERIREDRDLVARERAVDAAELERLGDVDRDDLRVRVRRADEVDIAHPVPLHIVEEDALTLDEPLVLLARDVRARETRGRTGALDDDRARGGFGHRVLSKGDWLRQARLADVAWRTWRACCSQSPKLMAPPSMRP